MCYLLWKHAAWIAVRDKTRWERDMLVKLDLLLMSSLKRDFR
jgi:hypothetical protein